MFDDAMQQIRAVLSLVDESPLPIATASTFPQNSAISSKAAAVTAPSSSPTPRTITSGETRAATGSRDDAGVAIVTSPTPERIAEFPHSTAAPE